MTRAVFVGSAEPLRLKGRFMIGCCVIDSFQPCAHYDLFKMPGCNTRTLLVSEGRSILYY